MTDLQTVGSPTVIVNLQRLEPAEQNPRTITANDFHNLCESIRADPKFLEERPILANQSGIIYAGNQRWHAVRHLYFEDDWQSPWGRMMLPVRYSDIDDKVARIRALQDNNHWGEYQEVMLSEILVDVREQDEDALSRLGFTNEDLDDILNAAGIEDYAGKLRDVDGSGVPDGDGASPADGSRPLEDTPPVRVTREPTTRSEVVVEIRCTAAFFETVKDELHEWGEEDGVEVNIS